MDTGLSGRRALVPGSTDGIGWAVARSLADEGAEVVLAGRRAELVAERADSLPSASGIAADLTTDDGIRSVLEAAGDVDVLVLNGGGPSPGTAADLGVDGGEASVERLLLPHIKLVDALLPGMRERGWGRIVAVGSSGVQQPTAGLAASNVGRAALAGYLKTLAAEVAGDGVTVNMVVPGRIATARVASLDAHAAERKGISVDEARRASVANIPAARYGMPEEFAAVVCFLASHPAAYVTGEQVRCDGGMIRHH